MRKILAAIAAVILSIGAYNLAPAQPASASRGCPNFSINGPVSHLTSANGYYYLLTSNGSVYAPCAPFYGSANGQGYFAGRTADYLVLCRNGYSGIWGYTIVDSTNATYNYGRTWGCS